MAALDEKADWLKERISCSVCLEIFDQPHTLACLHTLCKGCIDDLRPCTDDPKPCIDDLKPCRNDLKPCKNDFEPCRNYLKPCRNDLEPCKNDFEPYVSDLTPFPDDSVMGYMCPLCNQFCPKDRIRQNVLINELLEFYDELKNPTASTKSSKVAARCARCNNQSKAPTHHCMNCMIDLCEDCLSLHNGWQTMATHRVISLAETKLPPYNALSNKQQARGTIIVDRPITCPKHADNDLELNCVTCEQLICIGCRSSEHVGHTCESTEDAHARIIPRALKTKQNIERSLAGVSSIETLVVQSAKGIRTNIEALKTEAKDIHRQKQQQLDVDLKRLLSELDNERQRVKTMEERRVHIVQNHMNDAKHVIQCVDTAIATAKGASLLRELQSGIHAKLKQMENETKIKNKQLTAMGHIPGGDTQPLQLKPQLSNENTVGALVPVTEAEGTGASGHQPDVRPKQKKKKKQHRESDTPSVELPQEEVRSAAAISQNIIKFPRHETSRSWHFSLSKISQDHEKPMKIISFSDMSCGRPYPRHAVMNGQIWCIYDGCLRVFNQEGVKIRTLKLPGASPFTIAKLANAIAQYQSLTHSLIAVASDHGLYTMTYDSGKKIETLQPGHFVDVCIVDGIMYAYEYTEVRIYIFQAIEDDETIRNKWRFLKSIQHDHVSNGWSNSSISVTKNPTNVLFVYDSGSVITKYNLDDGKKIGRYGTPGIRSYQNGGLHGARLCGCDSEGNLLVCDRLHRIQWLSPTGRWTRVLGNTMLGSKYYVPEYAQSIDSMTFSVMADKDEGFWKMLIYTIY